jgi:hypothetical protein
MKLNGTLEQTASISNLAECMPVQIQQFYKEYIAYLTEQSDSKMAYVAEGRYLETDLSVKPYSNFGTKNSNIGCLVFLGDLHIDGDLLNDSQISNPLLIIHGNLFLRNWLRGGMSAFVTGNVNAKGYLLGKYEDAALFVGGSLNALGYLHRRKPYPDRPKFKPHQVFGAINAREFDVNKSKITNKLMRDTFVDSVLADNQNELWYDEEKIMAHGVQGKSIWRVDAS